jgi:molybdate transport system substrate-binding protein
VKLLAIFAAASLTGVFPAIDRGPKFQFAGSDQLAFQITQGAPADVFAAASPKYPEQLYAQGLCSKPAVFATNTVVLIVPRANPARIRSVYDLTRDGIKLVIGSKGAPIGGYTRKLLANLGLSSALKNVVSEEDDVKLVVAKVALGEADAGFVYRTDVKPVGNRVFRITVPAAGQPTVQYELCIPTTSQHPVLAAAFVREVLSKRGRTTLRTAGFGLP